MIWIITKKESSTRALRVESDRTPSSKMLRFCVPEIADEMGSFAFECIISLSRDDLTPNVWNLLLCFQRADKIGP